jgi:acetyl-CoA carboxylase biotin carboxyl carrier protein
MARIIGGKPKPSTKARQRRFAVPRAAAAILARRDARVRGRSQVSEIKAHITGTVWKVEVGVGQELEEGDTVVILESMKMEMPVEAEDAGIVEEVRCEEGQSVQEGDVLVVLG